MLYDSYDGQDFLYGRRWLLLPPGFTGVAVLASGTSAAHVALKHSERRTSRRRLSHELEEEMLRTSLAQPAPDEARTVERQAQSCTTRAPARPCPVPPRTIPASCQSRSQRSKKKRLSLPGLSRCVMTSFNARSIWVWARRASA